MNQNKKIMATKTNYGKRAFRAAITSQPEAVKNTTTYGNRADGTPITSQREAVLYWLRIGHTLTQEEARQMWSVTRLPSIINLLRNQLAREGGRDRIITQDVHGLNRFGARTRFGEYHLETVEE